MRLSECREKIDVIDREILQLLKRRAAIVAEIGRGKAASGLPVIDRAREREILNRVAADCDSVLSAESARCVFRCIIEESRRIQTAVVSRKEVETC
jgi:monofunctional chorismate mutase